MVWSRLLSSSVVLLCSSLALAHGPDEHAASELDFVGDLPIVLSVSRLAQPLSEAPGAVTVIDAETIRLSGARQLADVFRLIPGFQVGAMGSATRVYYHGVFEQFGQHMQVLVDGRSVYSPYFVGGVNWNNIPLALQDIERIEVLRGSNSAAFGSDAFLGVANIITKHPSETRGWLLSQTLGGTGIRDTVLRYGHSSEDFAWRTTFGRSSDDGFSAAPSAKDVRYVNARADWQLNMLDKLQLQVGGNNTGADKGYPNDVGCSTPPCHPGDMPRNSALTSGFASLKWQRIYSPDEELQVYFHHMQEQSTDRFVYGGVTPVPVLIDQSGFARRDDLEIQHIFSPGQDMRMVWGGQVRRDSVQSQPLFLTADNLGMTMTRLFGNWEWRVSPKAIVNLGASIENSSLTGFSSAPRVMLNYHVTPEQTVRVGMTRATRAPSIFEEKAKTIIGGVLVRFWSSGNFAYESVLSKEIGYLGDFQSAGVRVDMRLFHEGITGLGQVKGVDYLNLDSPDVYGAEWLLEYKPSATSKLSFNQSFLRIDSRYIPGVGRPPVHQDVLPTHNTSITWLQKLKDNLDFSLMLYSVGAMRWAGAPEPKTIPGYQRIDARLATPFNFPGGRGELALTVQNLGGSYYETDTYYLFDRRIMLTTTFQY